MGSMGGLLVSEVGSRVRNASIVRASSIQRMVAMWRGSHISPRQLMRKAHLQLRRIETSEFLRDIRVTCVEDGYSMTPIHSEWGGTWLRCRSGHIAEWDDVIVAVDRLKAVFG